MSFEIAKKLTLIIHMILILSVFLYFILRNWKQNGPIIIMYRTYISVFLWYIICLCSNGCPITHLENFISFKLFDRYFYPNYNFNDSMVSVFIKTPSNYFPLAVAVTYQLITHRWQARIASRRNM